MFCGKCGTKIDDDSKFCPNCGTTCATEKVHTDSPKSFKGKKKIIIGITVIVAAVILLIVLCGNSLRGSYYSKLGNCFEFYNSGKCLYIERGREYEGKVTKESKKQYKVKFDGGELPELIIDVNDDGSLYVYSHSSYLSWYPETFRK